MPIQFATPCWCRPPYPVPCRRSWSVGVDVQVTLQGQRIHKYLHRKWGVAAEMCSIGQTLTVASSSSLLTSDLSLWYRCKISVQLWSLKKVRGAARVKKHWKPTSVKKHQREEGKLNSPNVVQENIGHHLGSGYNWALGFIEGAGVVFNVAHLPHQCGDSPDIEVVSTLDLHWNCVV